MEEDLKLLKSGISQTPIIGINLNFEQCGKCLNLNINGNLKKQQYKKMGPHNVQCVYHNILMNFIHQ